MKANFTIEWPDECGPKWVNVDNLMLCLNTYCRCIPSWVINDINHQCVDINVTECADSASLNKLQRMLDQKRYTGRCVLRWSWQGRGFRLHETSLPGGKTSVRAAIDATNEDIDDAVPCGI